MRGVIGPSALGTPVCESSVIRIDSLLEPESSVPVEAPGTQRASLVGRDDGTLEGMVDSPSSTHGRVWPGRGYSGLVGRAGGVRSYAHGCACVGRVRVVDPTQRQRTHSGSQG